jgi:antitoxin (DNA-binding transcriptional repressor) of toxin-antitoxin stability system
MIRPLLLKDMATVYMTYSEVSSNFAAVLENIRNGVEVVVEQDHRPVALIRSPKRSGRPISECIASAKASGSKVTLDGGFAHDVEEGIKDRQEPWNPPSWD